MSNSTVSKSVTGFMFKGTINEFHENTSAVHGHFDWRNVVIARAVCPTGGVIVEVSANVGTETVSYLNVVEFTGRVIAFEPDLQLVLHIKSSLAPAHINQLVPHPIALAAEEETLRFHSVSDMSASGGGHLVYDHRDGGHDIQVPERKFDDVLKNEERNDVMLFDIEGGELRCLGGGCALIKRTRPVLEATDRMQQGSGGTLEQLAALLRESNYQVYSIQRFGLALKLGGEDGENWCCIPQEKASLAAKISRDILQAACLSPWPMISVLAG